MPTQAQIENLTSLAEAKFKKLGITHDMYDAVINYLMEGGALNNCGNVSGCKGACPEGQSCGRYFRGNCLCKKDD